MSYEFYLFFHDFICIKYIQATEIRLVFFVCFFFQEIDIMSKNRMPKKMSEENSIVCLFIQIYPELGLFWPALHPDFIEISSV